MRTVYEFVRGQQDSNRRQSVEITPGYKYNQQKTPRAIELYHNSHFTTVPKDSLPREKPFSNVNNFWANVVRR